MKMTRKVVIAEVETTLANRELQRVVRTLLTVPGPGANVIEVKQVQVNATRAKPRGFAAKKRKAAR